MTPEPTTGKHRPGCVEPRTQRRVNSIGVAWVTCPNCGGHWRDQDRARHPAYGRRARRDRRTDPDRHRVGVP